MRISGLKADNLTFVVTGTGRSGTGHIARLFTAAGHRCGHEDYFGVRAAIGEMGVKRGLGYPLIREPYHRLRESARRSRLDLQGDASWMAVPRLERFSGVSFLQTRHPLAVVRSFLASEFFTHPNPGTTHRTQRDFAQLYFESRPDPITTALAWWLEWNRRGQADADWVYPLESLDEALFVRLLECIGDPDPEANAEAAFAVVSGRTNTSEERGTERPELTWEEIPASSVKTAAVEYAAVLGYDPENNLHPAGTLRRGGG